MADPIEQFENAIRGLERRRRSRIFAIVHTGEPQHLCQPEFWTALRRRDEFDPDGTLELLIHSGGGHANVAYRLAKFFRSHCNRLNILIPMYAKSAATLLCLNADAIYMGEFAELGPLDAQLKDEVEKGQQFFSPLDEFKSMEYMEEYATGILDYFGYTLAERGMSLKQALHEAIAGTVGLMNPLYSHVDPSRVGSYRRALLEGEEYAKRLLASVNNEGADDLASHLVWDYPAHDFVIDFEEARALGLPVQRLPITQERLLINSLIGLMQNELPYLGFAKPARKPTVAKKGSKKKLPSSAPATQTGNGTKRTAA